MVEINLISHRERVGELVDLCHASLGPNMSEELWNWKYLQNPLASPNHEIIVAIDKGTIIGARPFMLCEIWIKDEKIKTAQPCDAMVHPGHRRQGIFDRMNQFAIEYFKQIGYALFYDFPNRMSLPGNLKQGWKIVSPVESLFRLVNPHRVASYALKNKFLGSGLGFLYDIFLNARTRKHSSSSLFEITVLDQFTDELKEVDTLRDKSGIDLVRSETYLRWRFDRHPKHRYKYILAKRDSKLWGYAVINKQSRSHGLVYGMIVDYLVKDGDIECFCEIMNRCIGELEELECDLLFTWAFTQPSFREKLIKGFGFKASSKFPYNRLWENGHFVTRELDKQILEEVDIYNKGNWRVTCAYADTM